VKTGTQALTILVTGANRGIGFATAQELALRGHRVLMTSRNAAAGCAAVDRIRTLVPGADVRVGALELRSFESIREFASWVPADVRLDTVIHNAGILIAAPERRLTENGFEECLQVHTVGPMLLTALLRPRLARPSRLIAVSSTLHAPATRGAGVDFNLLDPSLDSRYHPERAYKNAKLTQLWFVLEWERRYGAEGWHADAVCPGFVPTTAALSTQGGLRFLLKYILPLTPVATSVRKAANIEADWATHDLETPGGRYFDGRNVTLPSVDARDPHKAETFWRLASGWIRPFCGDL
jgi:NAD(P)-dependent dehydrogenase (short-subunit alcohol dehydrogenase family)